MLKKDYSLRPKKAAAIEAGKRVAGKTVPLLTHGRKPVCGSCNNGV